MKTRLFFCFIVIAAVCSNAGAAFQLKMTAEKTELLPGEQVVVTLYGWADAPLAVDQNGLNAWQFDALVDVGGVVEVTGVQFLAPGPWSTTDTGYTSLNTPQFGQIKYLHLVTQSLPQNSVTAVGGYSPLASFTIKAIGSEGQSVAYSIGGDFFGILADEQVLEGNFDSGASQNVFTIVPEPASFLIFSGMGLVGYLRRVRK